MEQARDWPIDLLVGLREDMAEMRARFVSLEGRLERVEQDLRRLDDRLFPLLLLQIGTLATALTALVVGIVA